MQGYSKQLFIVTDELRLGGEGLFGLVGERRTPDMEEYVGGGGCKGTHPVQGQVREEQLLVTVPPELLAGPVPKGWPSLS